MTFYDELHKYDYQQVVASFDTITEEDVLRAIATPNPTVEDFKALISPKAVPFFRSNCHEGEYSDHRAFWKDNSALPPPLFIQLLHK